MRFHEKLHTLRKAAGMTQADLAEKLNVSRQAVSRWEMGTAMPDIENLIAMSDLFGITLDEMLKEKKATPQAEPVESSGAAGVRYRDCVPRWWWIPAAAGLAVQALLYLYQVLCILAPGFTVLVNQSGIKSTVGWIALSAYFFPKAAYGLTAVLLFWGFVRWMKVK